jgi:hypothetical protein
VTGVSHSLLAAGSSCADSTVCNGNETCNAAGACVAGTPPTVDDGSVCTTDACDPVSGVSHTPLAAGPHAPIAPSVTATKPATPQVFAPRAPLRSSTTAILAPRMLVIPSAASLTLRLPQAPRAQTAPSVTATKPATPVPNAWQARPPPLTTATCAPPMPVIPSAASLTLR